MGRPEVRARRRLVDRDPSIVTREAELRGDSLIRIREEVDRLLSGLRLALALGRFH